MADLDNLTLTVETEAEGASASIGNLTESLKGLQNALGSIDTKKLSGMTSGLSAVKESVKKTGLSSYTKQLKDQSKALAGFKNATKFASGVMSTGWKGAKQTITGVSGALKGLTNMFGLGEITSSRFIASLARIAGYRFIRTLISGITNSAKTGLENLARASSEANATLSQLSSGALTLQNAMGGALYSVIASIIGLLNSVISAAVTAINWVSMLFAILGGRSTFKKATSATKEYASALGGAGGAAKALKQELMAFDEINSLSPDSGGGGGGGGGGGMLDYGSMFEEVPVSESLKQMVDNADFTLLGVALADKINAALGRIDWSRIETGAWKLARSLVTFLNGFISKIEAPLIGEAIAGLINTGLTFINTIRYDADWKGLGSKVKTAIQTAIMSIDAKDVGKFISLKLNVAIAWFKGLLPKTSEEWSQITDWIAGCINASINAIDKGGLATVVSGVINGGLSLVTSLAEAGTLTNIVSAVAEAIKGAIENVSEEDLKAAAVALIREALNALKVIFDLVLEIGDTTLGKALTGFALFKLLSNGMSMLGLKGYMTSATAFTMSGSIVMALDAVAGISDIVSDSSEGNKIEPQKIADVAGSALTSAGFGIMKAAPAAGGVLLTLGLVLKFVSSTEFEWVTGKVAQTFTGVVGGAAVEAMENLETATAGAVLSESELANVTKYTNMILEGAKTPIEKAAAVLFIMNKELLNASEFSALLANLGITSETVATGVAGLASVFASMGTNTETAEGAVSEVSTAVENVGGALDEMPVAVDIPKVPEGTAESYTGVANAMQATGEQAETLKTKIITIPSDIVFNLELANYDTVISNLETLATSVGSAGSTGAENFKTGLSGLSDWVGTNVTTPITNKISGINWYSLGNSAMSAFKRGLKSVSMPKFSVMWTVNSKSASILGKTFYFSIPTPSIKMYARGGFPEAGELFMANEAGPELVGRIGNKSAVANEGQIGDAIFRYMDAHSEQSGGMNYDSMANALVRAMKSAGLGAFYLDGKQIKQSLNREAQRSGKPVTSY